LYLHGNIAPKLLSKL